MKQVAVLNVVGLTQDLISEDTPFLKAWSHAKNTSYIQGNVPAVTCTSQSNYLTGKWPKDHGIVANGWYFKDECEVKLWRQSNKLVQSPKIWDVAKSKNPDFTCANLFWWYNMYSSADYSVTPRPIYRADGLKLPDCYSNPSYIRDELQTTLGTFPLFKFWGPMTSIDSSKWIADAAIEVLKKYNPTLNLVYLPHLDYNLQRIGPNHALISRDLREIDDVCKNLIEFYESNNVNVLVLSEYGITEVHTNIALNRIFRQKEWIQVREEMGGELLDCGASKIFAMADHQIAHIYINDKSLKNEVRNTLETITGISEIIDPEVEDNYQLAHERCGDLIVISKSDYWFSYYYWLDENKKPDFAKTVDIHRKPGYDPMELFMDPGPLPRLKIIKTLIKKKLGFRYVMDVIPTTGELVKGSHGAPINDLTKGPLLISDVHNGSQQLAATEIFSIILKALNL